MKTKALIRFAVTAKLICAFVFAYAEIRFSHDAAHFILKIETFRFIAQVISISSRLKKTVFVIERISLLFAFLIESKGSCVHYENLPMQCMEIVLVAKMNFFTEKKKS